MLYQTIRHFTFIVGDGFLYVILVFNCYNSIKKPSPFVVKIFTMIYIILCILFLLFKCTCSYIFCWSKSKIILSLFINPQVQYSYFTVQIRIFRNIYIKFHSVHSHLFSPAFRLYYCQHFLHSIVGHNSSTRRTQWPLSGYSVKSEGRKGGKLVCCPSFLLHSEVPRDTERRKGGEGRGRLRQRH